MHVELPSGLVVDFRKIRGHEIVRIAEGGGAGNGMADVLSGCWLSTVDPGPYPANAFGDDGAPAWPRLLKGDLVAGLIALRRESLEDGDAYDFDVQCEACRAKVPWTVSLSALPVRALPAASADRLRTGQPFEHRGPGKVPSAAGGPPLAPLIRYHLATLAQEEPVVRLMKQTKRRTSTLVDDLAGRVVSIEGVNPDIRARWNWLADLSMGELQGLQAAFDASDCGVDTAIEVRCPAPECGWDFEVALPLGRRFFLLRRKPATPSVASSPATTGSGGAPLAPTSGGTSTAGAATT